MILQSELKIVANQLIAIDTYEMILEGDLVEQIEHPGQFVHVKIGQEFTHMLRRPFSIADYNCEKKQMTIIYKNIGEGTQWLSHQTTGQTIDVVGPLGNGFNIENLSGKKILVIGGGVGVPPLHSLCKQLSSTNDVTAVLGYQSKEAVFYENEFRQYANTHITTDDGSYGHSGLVTDVIDHMSDEFNYYFACGPLGMLRAIQQKLDHIQGFLSVEERMGCGVGACFACVCEANNEKGYVKICQDGPVFHTSEVTL